MKAIVGLFTDLIPPGGVQRAGRHVAAVVARFAADRGMATRFLSLNDPRGAHTMRAGNLEFSAFGYDASKPQFVLAALRAAGSEPTLVLALHPHLAPVPWVMKLRGAQCRSIIFAHGIEVWQPLGWPRGAALRHADTVIGPSADTLQHLGSDQGVLPGKARLLPWALDPEFELRQKAAVSWAPPPGFPTQGKIILTIGRWAAAEKYKGADTLIAALPRLLTAIPETSLVLVGDGDDRPRLERLARDLGVAARTLFLHGLSVEQLSACYANCDLFALPSRGEGFGLVFLEAMSYAKPVVGGAHGGIPDIVQDGVTGLLVPHGDVERLAHALEWILSDERRAREMGARGKQRVAAEFSFARFQERLAKILSSMLSQEP